MNPTPLIRTPPVLRLSELGWAMDNKTPGYSQAEVLKRFQAASLDREGRPLEVDGQFGPITFDALYKEYPLPGQTLPERMLAVAASQIGIREVPPGSNRGPQVDLYLKWCGLDPKNHDYPWCAAFVYWVIWQAARQLRIKTPCPKAAGVLNLWELAGYSASGLKRVTAVEADDDPELIKPGMQFLLKTGPRTGHTGLVERVNKYGQLITIEGNSNEGGSREGVGVFRLDKRRIDSINLGFIDYSK